MYTMDFLSEINNLILSYLILSYRYSFVKIIIKLSPQCIKLDYFNNKMREHYPKRPPPPPPLP